MGGCPSVYEDEFLDEPRSFDAASTNCTNDSAPKSPTSAPASTQPTPSTPAKVHWQVNGNSHRSVNSRVSDGDSGTDERAGREEATEQPNVVRARRHRYRVNELDENNDEQIQRVGGADIAADFVPEEAVAALKFDLEEEIARLYALLPSSSFEINSFAKELQVEWKALDPESKGQLTADELKSRIKRALSISHHIALNKKQQRADLSTSPSSPPASPPANTADFKFDFAEDSEAAREIQASVDSVLFHQAQIKELQHRMLYSFWDYANWKLRQRGESTHVAPLIDEEEEARARSTSMFHFDLEKHLRWVMRSLPAAVSDKRAFVEGIHRDWTVLDEEMFGFITAARLRVFVWTSKGNPPSTLPLVFDSELQTLYDAMIQGTGSKDHVTFYDFVNAMLATHNSFEVIIKMPKDYDPTADPVLASTLMDDEKATQQPSSSPAPYPPSSISACSPSSVDGDLADFGVDNSSQGDHDGSGPGSGSASTSAADHDGSRTVSAAATASIAANSSFNSRATPSSSPRSSHSPDEDSSAAPAPRHRKKGGGGTASASPS